MRNFTFACCLLLSIQPGFAQRIQFNDLIRYLNSPISTFEQDMLCQGFTCYHNSMSLRGRTCLFAYQPIPYPAPPDRATALIQFTQNTQSNVIVYQVHSASQYKTLLAELARAGYRMASKSGGSCTFSRDRTTITCRQTDPSNGVSGNYQGHSLTLVQARTPAEFAAQPVDTE